MILLTLTSGDWIAIIGIALTIITGFSVLIYKTGSLVTLIEGMKPDVRKIPSIETKVDELWRLKTTSSGSPSFLNDHGKKILTNSKIDEIVSIYYDEILRLMREHNPANAYNL